MTIITRYVRRNFLVVLIGAIVAFLALFVIIDLVEHLEEFIDQDAPLIAPVLYYLNYVPFIVILTLPVAMLLASLSTVGAMTRDSEMVALKASGVSPFRVIRTLGALALVVTALAFVVGESLVPAANEKKAMVWNRYVDKQGPISRTETVNRTLTLGAGRTLFVKRFNAEENQGLDIMLAESIGTQPLRILQAARMNYLGDGGAWRLEDVTERTWSDDRETYRKMATLNETLEEVTPAELAAGIKRPEEMGFVELREYVRRGVARGRDVTRPVVDLHMKVAVPFANFIIVLFGAALAAVRRRTGLAVGFAASILICFIYYGFLRTGQALGYNGDLPPLLAAWIGNLVFGGLSLGFLYRARF
jgi:lipopolysaccharide export system permease protein